MIKCKSKFEFEYLKEYYYLMFGFILVNERKRIIYLPSDITYKKRFLNRESKKNEHQ